MITITIEEYEEMCENYQGKCTNCGAVQDGVEPDADNYECDECDCACLIGVDNWLLEGRVV